MKKEHPIYQTCVQQTYYQRKNQDELQAHELMLKRGLSTAHHSPRHFTMPHQRLDQTNYNHSDSEIVTDVNKSETYVRNVSPTSVLNTKVTKAIITAANIMYSSEEAPFCCFLGVAFLIRATAALSSFITDHLWLTVVD